MAKAYQDVCPCKNCKERKIGCHAICVAYKEWKKKGIEIEVTFMNYQRRKRNGK